MQMLYNSDSFAVVQFDVPATEGSVAGDVAAEAALTRGGYEIVDKFARKEIFIEGVLAASFRAGVEALIETSPTEDEVDAFIGRYTSLMQQPLIVH